MYEADKAGMEAKVSKRRSNEVPFQSVKGFSQIKLKEESLIVPSL